MLRPPRLFIRAIAFMLITAVTWTTGAQMRAEAMLVPASAVPSETQTNRAQDVAVIQKTLESKILRSKLESLGLTQAEIDSRLSKMSDQEVHQFASQIKAVNPAGFVVYVLVVVILVLFVIYLAKRI